MEALHIGLALPFGLLWIPVGLSRSARHLWWHCHAAAERRRESFTRYVPQSWLGWGEAITVLPECPLNV